jgi:rhodanese-related sulfurtransferase
MSTQTPTAQPTASLRDVDPATVQAWLAEGRCQLIDVREADEYAREHIAGAVLHPLSRFNPAALQPKSGQCVVMQCRSGRRSADAAKQALVALGNRAEIYNLTGGIEAWKRASLPVETNRQAPPLGVLQQTQFAIGSMVLAGLALGWFVHPVGYLLSAFMGVGLLFAALSGLCPLASLIARMPWNQIAAGGACADGRCDHKH